MQKNKPYQFLRTGTLSFFLSLLIYACALKKAEQDHLVSTIITWNKVSVYSGELKLGTIIEYSEIEEEKIKALFAKKKAATDKVLSLLLKLSVEEVGAGFLGQIGEVIRWAKQSGINNIELVNLTEMDQTVFKLPATTWAWVDSFAMPGPLQLNMPKDEEGLDLDKIDKNAPSVLSVVVHSPYNWYCYAGTDSAGGSFFNREEYATLLKEKKKKWGEQLIVLSRIAPGAVPESIIASLEEKSNSKIKNYELIWSPPAPAEIPKRKLTAAHFLRMMPPEPVEIIPGTVSEKLLPEDNAFIIEMRADQSVWYQSISKTSRIAPQKVDKPVTVNLKAIIAAHEQAKTEPVRYLIKGDPKAKYPVFEQVINALKQNNIYKYNLVTSTDQ